MPSEVDDAAKTGAKAAAEQSTGGTGGTGSIGGISEIPFPEVEPFTLLGFDPARSAPEMEYDSFGHARLPVVELVSREEVGEGSALRVVDARLLALHSADDGEALSDDIELEFWVDDDTAIVVSLSLFLERRAGPLIGSERALVLALCNPYRARLSRPAGVEVPIFYAEGDVIAYFEVDDDRDLDALSGAEEIERGCVGVRVRLVAERWREIP